MQYWRARDLKASSLYITCRAFILVTTGAEMGPGMPLMCWASAVVICQSLASLLPALIRFFSMAVLISAFSWSSELGMSSPSFSSSEGSLLQDGYALHLSPADSPAQSGSQTHCHLVLPGDSSRYWSIYLSSPIGMSAEMGSGGRFSGTCDIVTILPVGLHTGTSIGVSKEIDPSAQFITMETVDTVTWLWSAHHWPLAEALLSFLVLADSIVALTAFLALKSSALSILLCWVGFTLIIGNSVAMRGETRFSTATVVLSLDADLLDPIHLSVEIVALAVLVIFNTCDHLRWLRTNAKKCQPPGPYIEANMQMSGGKAEKAMTLPKSQGHLCPRKGTSFTLA